MASDGAIDVGLSDPADWPEGFRLSRDTDAAFDTGLRSFFAYRDLGLAEASAGAVRAHIIRANGSDFQSTWHWHDVSFQLVYVLQGTITFDYEGVGRVTLEPGTCVHQPPRIRHREVGHSTDLVLIEIVAPADFKTQEIETADQEKP